VHIEEVPEEQPEPQETGLPPGFTHPNSEDMDQGDRLFICFIGEHQDTQATQAISQKLAEVTGETHPTFFKDIVPKPYQEFRDIFAKESFDELLDQKKWDHTIELIPDAQMFSTKVYPLAPVKQKQQDNFLEENLKAHAYAPPNHPWPLWSSSSKRRMGVFA